MTTRVCVIRDDLIIVAGIHREELHALNDHLRGENIKLTVLGIAGDGEFLDYRDAPSEVSDAARTVIDWLATRKELGTGYR